VDNVTHLIHFPSGRYHGEYSPQQHCGKKNHRHSLVLATQADCVLIAAEENVEHDEGEECVEDGDEIPEVSNGDMIRDKT
jgi:hypothetical protein